MPGSSLHFCVICGSQVQLLFRVVSVQLLFRVVSNTAFFFFLNFFWYQKSVFMCVRFEVQVCLDFQ